MSFEPTSDLIEYVLNKSFETFIDGQIHEYIETMKLKLQAPVDDYMNKFIK